ncbi:hypothetical protein DERP_009605 [Dermatophagoides pteronyssinus]|uniref:RING-CH-type domain-containing protein n=1 Tax=Dermatophagoides pteronyssinus TaxID=6956 RepID=A0ABQ8JAF4_DERPT|nr:hypothetical protein DERP_009605 [Dermatophagoides pteronyssinus]
MERLQYCRLCLKPENVNRLEQRFVSNLCYCRESNFHRQCLVEWIESTGFTNCHRCQCEYNVTIKPNNLAFYPIKLILIILLIMRCYLNAKSLYYFIQKLHILETKTFKGFIK